jgi:hypothetical protein
MIKLTDDQISVLGRPNFACAQWAKLLIAGGMYEDKAKKVEYEQAVFIHFSLDMLEQHGDQWLKEANKVLKDLAVKQIAKRDNISDN